MKDSFPGNSPAINTLALTIALIKRVSLLVLAVFVLYIGIDLFMSIYRLYCLFPRFGLILTIGLVLAVLFMSISAFRILRKLPRRAEPPDPLKFPESGSPAYQRDCIRYLNRRITSLIDHRHLQETTRASLRETLASLRGKGDPVLRIDHGFEELTRAVRELDQIAEREVRQTVRETAVGVAMSPYRSMDILFVLLRNFQLTLHIILLYHQRPTPAQVFRYSMDIVKIMSGVHILNYSERFTKQLLTSVPILNSTIDDMIQGIGAGILTASVGKATIQRCRALQRWNPTTESARFEKVAPSILKEVKRVLSGVFSRFTERPRIAAWSAIKTGWNHMDWSAPVSGHTVFSRIHNKILGCVSCL